jgi:hypothetical protein
MNYTPVPENRDGVFFLNLGKPRFDQLERAAWRYTGIVFFWSDNPELINLYSRANSTGDPDHAWDRLDWTEPVVILMGSISFGRSDFFRCVLRASAELIILAWKSPGFPDRNICAFVR